MALQIRRGTEAQRAALSGVDVPALGELLYTTNTKKLYIGDGITTGGVEAGYFSSVEVAGEDTLVSTGDNGALTIVAGTGISINTNTVSNSLTIDGFAGGLLSELTVGEVWDVSPTDSSVDFEGSGNRLLRMVGNVSTYGQEVGVDIDMSAYRSSPTNGNGGPRLVFRQSSLISPNLPVATIQSVITNVGFGQEAGKLVISLIDAQDVVSIDSTGVIGNLTGDVTGDVTGNVYATDTTLLVDAVNGILKGELVGHLTGDVKGSVFADDSTVLVDGPAGVLRGELVGSLTTPQITISNNNITAIDPSDDINISANNGRVVVRGNLFSERIDLLLDPTVGGVGVYNSTSTNSMLSMIQAHASASTTQPINIPGIAGGPIAGSPMTFIRGRGTLLSLQAVNPLDDLGSITFAGFDGAAFPISANIVASVPSAATIASGIVEGSLKLEVADATGTLATKFKVEAERVSSLKPFNLVSVDSTARSALTPAFGDIIYNTTANKFQGWQNTSGTTPEWVDLS